MKASIQINRFLRIHLLVALLLFLPTCSHASQGFEADTSYVLAIYHQKKKATFTGEKSINAQDGIKKISYIGTGASANIKLRNGQEIKDARIYGIDKHSLVVNEKEIFFSDIAEIKVGTQSQRIRSKAKGIVLLALGGIGGLFLFLFFFVSFGGMRIGDAPGIFSLFVALPLFIILAGINKLRNLNPTFKVEKNDLKLKGLPSNSLPRKLIKKLQKRSYAI